MSATCVVCGKEFRYTDQAEHLANNHLGPHYFWFDMKKYRTMEPSMTMAKVKQLADAPSLYYCCETRDGKDIYYSDSEAVDLTHTPHFSSYPPATF